MSKPCQSSLGRHSSPPSRGGRGRLDPVARSGPLSFVFAPSGSRAPSHRSVSSPELLAVSPFFFSLRWRCRRLSDSVVIMAVPFQAVIDTDDSLEFPLQTSQPRSWQPMTTMARPRGLRRVAKRAPRDRGPHDEHNAPSHSASSTVNTTASLGKL